MRSRLVLESHSWVEATVNDFEHGKLIQFLIKRHPEFTLTVINYQTIFLKILILEALLAAAQKEIFLVAIAVLTADKKHKNP